MPVALPGAHRSLGQLCPTRPAPVRPGARTWAPVLTSGARVVGVVIVGPHNSGKTSVCRMITGARTRRQSTRSSSSGSSGSEAGAADAPPTPARSAHASCAPPAPMTIHTINPAADGARRAPDFAACSVIDTGNAESADVVLWVSHLASVVVVVHDVANPDSVRAAHVWLDLFRSEHEDSAPAHDGCGGGDAAGTSDLGMQVVVVANKADMLVPPADSAESRAARQRQWGRFGGAPVRYVELSCSRADATGATALAHAVASAVKAALLRGRAHAAAGGATEDTAGAAPPPPRRRATCGDRVDASVRERPGAPHGARAPVRECAAPPAVQSAPLRARHGVSAEECAVPEAGRLYTPAASPVVCGTAGSSPPPPPPPPTGPVVQYTERAAPRAEPDMHRRTSAPRTGVQAPLPRRATARKRHGTPRSVWRGCACASDTHSGYVTDDDDSVGVEWHDAAASAAVNAPHAALQNTCVVL